MIQNFKEDYCSAIPLVRFYFRRIMDVILSMLEGIPQESLVLDFGCGRQFFKKISGFKNVVGYDIVSEFSDIKDYRILYPEVIICNHVLEHLDIIELRETLDNFKMMGPKIIITGVPTENIISRICTMIGRSQSHFGHKTKIGIIHRELNKRFVLLRRKNILTLTVVSVWK